MQATYSLRPDENSIFVLQINGKDCLCPLQPAIAIPFSNALGHPQIALQRMQCGLHCPKAMLFESGTDKETYRIECCGDGVKDFEIEKAVQRPTIIIGEPEQPTSNKEQKASAIIY